MMLTVTQCTFVSVPLCLSYVKYEVISGSASLQMLILVCQDRINFTASHYPAEKKSYKQNTCSSFAIYFKFTDQLNHGNN